MKGCYFEYLFHTNNEYYYLVGLQDNSLSWGWFKQKICVVFNEIRSQHNVFLAAFLICLSGVPTNVLSKTEISAHLITMVEPG